MWCLWGRWRGWLRTWRDADADAAEEDDAVEGAEEEGARRRGRRLLEWQAAPTETDLEEGARVDVNWQGTGSWYVATVKHVHDGGACDVAYDDGDEETVPLARLRLRSRAGRASA